MTKVKQEIANRTRSSNSELEYISESDDLDYFSCEIEPTIPSRLKHTKHNNKPQRYGAPIHHHNTNTHRNDQFEFGESDRDTFFPRSKPTPKNMTAQKPKNSQHITVNTPHSETLTSIVADYKAKYKQENFYVEPVIEKNSATLAFPKKNLALDFFESHATNGKTFKVYHKGQLIAESNGQTLIRYGAEPQKNIVHHSKHHMDELSSESDDEQQHQRPPRRPNELSRAMHNAHHNATSWDSDEEHYVKPRRPQPNQTKDNLSNAPNSAAEKLHGLDPTIHDAIMKARLANAHQKQDQSQALNATSSMPGASTETDPHLDPNRTLSFAEIRAKFKSAEMAHPHVPAPSNKAHKTHATPTGKPPGWKPPPPPIGSSLSKSTIGQVRKADGGLSSSDESSLEHSSKSLTSKK